MNENPNPTSSSPTASAPTEDTLGTGGLALHLAHWGPPTQSDRVVILVHGLSANSRTFIRLGPLLATRGFHAVALDLRGRGRSSKPAHGYGIPFHADDIQTICDQLGARQVDVVGHSLGAFIGVYLAALAPQRVRRLVMIDAGGNIPEDSQQAIAAAINRLGASFPSLDAYLATMRQLPMIQWNDLWEQYFRYDAEVHPDGTVTSGVPRSAIEQENFCTGSTRTEVLPSFVRQPTLLLRAQVGLLGPDRGLILPRAEAARLQAEMPDCRVVEVPDANHYTIIESPVLEREIIEFLSQPSA